MRTRLRRALERMLPTPRGPLVLCYHRVAEPAIDPWRLAVQPARFADQLDILVRYARPVPLDAALDHRSASSGVKDRTPVALTVDDGYADLVTTALPALERAGIPATVYLVSDAIGGRGHWWDTVAAALLGPSIPPGPLRLRIDGQDRTWEPARHPDRHALHREIWALLRDRPPAERDALADDIAGWRGAPAVPITPVIDDAALATLAGHPLIDIGAHTRRHPRLSVRTPAEQEDEIAGSRRALAARIDRPVTAFAYPHGASADIGAHAPRLVREAGFRSGVTTSPGTVRDGGDPMRIPRLVVEDLDGEAFLRLLRRHGLGVS